ncbi:hypothetical protein F511_09020 [Dorcoceras hygrometricum]|uniref:Uncharacterized protein n=1 Tax=Dorcoceras hygrometricum TaxID=472368 RepID=A0A2Z7CF97_9LAMI|nr:hypothetical protein F511_09020 [Dorcoceras hygrometricum]
MKFDPADGACVYLRNIALIPCCDTNPTGPRDLGSFRSFKWVAIEREVPKEPNATENTQIFDGERRKSREESLGRKLTTGTHDSHNNQTHNTVATTRRNYQTQAVQSQAIQSQAIQTQAIQTQAIQFRSFKWVAIEREVPKEPSATENTQIFDGERRKSREESLGRNYQTQLPNASCPVASYPVASYPDASYPDASYPVASYPDASYPVASYPDASYPVASYPDASYPVASYPDAILETQRFNLTIRRRVAPSTGSSNPQLVIQSQHSNRGVQLNQTTPLLTAALSSRNTIPLATGSSILRLVILSRAQRLPDATQAQQLLFHFHQLQATVTIKFQILPVVGYSTADSILRGIRQLLIFKLHG